MTFAGFSVIVVALRQIAGKPFSPLQVLFTQLFIELGLLTALIAMLPPTLAICGIRDISNRRPCSNASAAGTNSGALPDGRAGRCRG